MNLRNLLNLSGVDKITALKIFNDKYQDEWSEHEYFVQLKQAGMEELALNFLAQTLSEKPHSLWAVSNYAQEIVPKSGKRELIALPDKKSSLSRVVANTTDKTHKRYKVKAGDTLQMISQQFFNTTRRWQDIMTLNSDNLSHSDDLHPGMELLIPKGKE